MTDKELENARAQVGRLMALVRTETERRNKARLVKCYCCGKRTKVTKLSYIQTHWYVQPYGCTGGDYWKSGEGRFECPKCGGVNRLYKRPDVEALKRHFGAIEDTY